MESAIQKRACDVSQRTAYGGEEDRDPIWSACCNRVCGHKLDGVSWRTVCPNDTYNGNLDGVLIDTRPVDNDENLGGIRIRSGSWTHHYR